MYGLPDYGRMLAEPLRFEAYRRAIARAVKPGDVVIDLGSGPGVFALLAAQAGAAVVYAVEPDAVVELVAPIAQLNGVGDRVISVPQLSTRWAPPKQADVIISDLRGILPTFTEHLPSLADARTRLLRPGGCLLPQKDEIWAAPVSAPEALHRHLGGFSAISGVDLAPARRMTSHQYCRVELTEEALAAQPRRLCTLDYRTVEEPSVRSRAEFELTTARVDGIAVWFDAFLDNEESFSNSPAAIKMIYGQAFFPLPASFDAVEGDRLRLRFSAHHNPSDYLYRWVGSIERNGVEIAAFDQSTFHGTLVTVGDVAKRAPDYVPNLGQRSEIDRKILLLLDGRTSLGAAASKLRSLYPNLFDDDHGALRRVVEVSDRYGDYRGRG